jgi:hypothetical protein
VGVGKPNCKILVLGNMTKNIGHGLIPLNDKCDIKGHSNWNFRRKEYLQGRLIRTSEEGSRSKNHSLFNGSTGQMGASVAWNQRESIRRHFHV